MTVTVGAPPDAAHRLARRRAATGSVGRPDPLLRLGEGLPGQRPARVRAQLDAGPAPLLGRDDCHTHPLQTFPGVASGSFRAPDHEYPSYLNLTLTATRLRRAELEQDAAAGSGDDRAVVPQLALGPPAQRRQRRGDDAVRAARDHGVLELGHGDHAADKTGTLWRFASWADGGSAAATSSRRPRPRPTRRPSPTRCCSATGEPRLDGLLPGGRPAGVPDRAGAGQRLAGGAERVRRVRLDGRRDRRRRVRRRRREAGRAARERAAEHPVARPLEPDPDHLRRHERRRRSALLDRPARAVGDAAGPRHRVRRAGVGACGHRPRRPAGLLELDGRDRPAARSPPLGCSAPRRPSAAGSPTARPARPCTAPSRRTRCRSRPARRPRRR